MDPISCSVCLEDVVSYDPSARSAKTDVVSYDPSARSAKTDVVSYDPSVRSAKTDVVSYDPSARSAKTDVVHEESSLPQCAKHLVCKCCMEDWRKVCRKNCQDVVCVVCREVLEVFYLIDFSKFSNASDPKSITYEDFLKKYSHLNGDAHAN